MFDLKFTYFFIRLLPICLFGLVACTSESNEVLSETDLPIRWSVQSDNLKNGRALIESSANLQTACSDGGQAIGIWSAYQRDGEALTEHVLGTAGDASLTFEAGEPGNWTYGEKLAYWKRNAVYYFNAYFPKEGGMANIAHTSTSISGMYDTSACQQDLMVYTTTVNTGVENFQGSPVELPMAHALAAIRFQFETIAGSSMSLKSFSLKNKTNSGLSTSATLVYDGGDLSIADWRAATPVSGNIYEWQHPGSGVLFNEKTKAIAYTPQIDGNKYTENNGYVLIIPQEYKGTTNINFTIDGKDPFEMELPAQNFLPGFRYTYLIKVMGGEPVSLECVAQPWDLVETTNEFSTVVSVLDEDRIDWTKGSHNDSDENPNNNAQIVLWDDINRPAEFTFKISHPLGGTWHAILRTVSGATDAFELRDMDGKIKTDGAVGENVTLRVCAKRVNTTTVSNIAELMFVVRSNGLILPVAIMTVLGENQNYMIIQNINK